MPDTVTHPNPEVLSAFARGKLPDAAVAAVARHLETCPACRKAVEHLPPDSFIGKLRAAKPGTSSPPPGRALTRVAGSPTVPKVGAEPSGPPEHLPPELASHPKYRFVRELGRGGMRSEQRVRIRNRADRLRAEVVLDNTGGNRFSFSP